MKLVRWMPLNPARELSSFQDEVSRLFEDFVGRTSVRGDLAPMFAPPVDIRETPEEYELAVDLPGVTLADVAVSLVGQTLTIKGERRAEVEKQNGNLWRGERMYGVFERSFDLGSAVRSDGVKASYKDGVLHVRVPKAEEARVRHIAVEAG
jgi:HSP20 family protein